MAGLTPDLIRSWSDDPRLSSCETELYRRVDDVELVMHAFRPQGHRADPAPAILFFHGGGWNGGEPAQFGEQCKHLARKGMVAFTAEYRVAERQNTTPWACVEDAVAALRWVRDNAERLGVDEKRIATGGGSAGGHLGACVGVCPVLAGTVAPAAMVLFNPVLDLSDQRRSERFAGRDWQLASPNANVKPGDPPTIIFHGKADDTVPPIQAEEFAGAMTAAGNRCELRLYQDAGHGFFNYARRDSGFYAKTVAEMDSFLASLGWL
jgi:acetyl esterase/lipase